MEDDDFFVMLTTQNGSYTPVVIDDNELAKFTNAEDAREAAENTVLGEAFGFEVFELGCGVY